MKKYLKTICVGNFYNYCLYKITDAVGRSYFLAEPVLHGVTRIAESELGLKTILERDAVRFTQFQQKVH